MDNIAASPIQSIPKPSVNIPPIQNAPANAETPTEETATTFEQVHQMPYSAKYFGMTKSQYFALQQADITDLSPKMTAIDQYVREKIQTDKYIDSTTTYTKMMEEIKSMLGIKEYESPAAQIEKIFLYITRGKGMARQFRVKRSSIADTRDHAKNMALKELQSRYPNKTGKLARFLNTLTN